MAEVRRVKLPGVGVLHTFITDDGGHTGSTQIGQHLIDAADRFART